MGSWTMAIISLELHYTDFPMVDQMYPFLITSCKCCRGNEKQKEIWKGTGCEFKECNKWCSPKKDP